MYIYFSCSLPSVRVKHLGPLLDGGDCVPVDVLAVVQRRRRRHRRGHAQGHTQHLLQVRKASARLRDPASWVAMDVFGRVHAT